MNYILLIFLSINMSLNNYFIVKHNSKIFESNTIVKYCTNTYSGKCYLVVDLNDDLKREWILKYDLYPIDSNMIDNWEWFYNEKFDKLAKEFMLLGC